MISIIVPVFNEEGVIGKTLRYLKAVKGEIEIIVVDGGSSDNTIREVQQLEDVILVDSKQKGRAAQMNAGAKSARGSVLYFIHADSIPPDSFPTDIAGAIDRGYNIGCYRLRFDFDHWFLKANAWFTRFDVNAFRFGDQSLFVQKDLFVRVGGFKETHIVMEDQEIITRLRKHGRFIILRKPIITSARKYVVNGVYRTQAVFFLIYFMYKMGYSQEALRSAYKKLIRQDKL
jgi:rSAM/selenodomain-associated transferase 2